MRLRVCLLLSLVAIVPALMASDLRLGSRTTLHFAPLETGHEILSSRDAFVERLSLFDRASRLHTDQDVSEEEFLRYLASCVQAWTPEWESALAVAWEDVRPAIDALALPFPEKVQLIATSGQDEGHAAYTRGTAIVFPRKKLAGSRAELAHLLAHELFHVLTRHNPHLRDRLYGTIGFHPCPELEFPATLRARRITNPDAPELRHRIQLRPGGETVWAMPILFASSERYDLARGGEFFDYLVLKLLVLEPDADGPVTRAVVDDAGSPRLLDFPGVPDFFTQVGRNTHYIIHPEEILAENFAMLVLGASNVPSPDVLERMRAVLAEFGHDGNG